jgi:uncharacterized RDD family membrane protein YckC
VNPATFRQRSVARAIDLVILSMLMIAALSGFVETDEDGDGFIDAPTVFLVALAIAVLAYEVVPVYLRGQTVGKRLLRIRIVRADDGGRPSFVSSFVRWGLVVGVYLLVGAFSATLAIGVIAVMYASAIADPEGRNMLDRAARTRVVRVESTPPEA